MVGEGDLSDEVARALEAPAPTSSASAARRDEISAAIEAEGVDSVPWSARDDAFVLRMALIVRSVVEEIPLLLTIFDQTMAEQVTAATCRTRM